MPIPPDEHVLLLAERWLKLLSDLGRTQATLAAYRWSARAGWYWKAKPLSDVTLKKFRSHPMKEPSWNRTQRKSNRLLKECPLNPKVKTGRFGPEADVANTQVR